MTARIEALLETVPTCLYVRGINGTTEFFLYQVSDSCPCVILGIGLEGISWVNAVSPGMSVSLHETSHALSWRTIFLVFETGTFCLYVVTPVSYSASGSAWLSPSHY